MNKATAILFLKRFSENSSTPAEQEDFLAWLNSAPEPDIEDIARKYEDILQAFAESGQADARLVKLIEERLNEEETAPVVPLITTVPVVHRSPFWRRYAGAAAAVLLLVLSGAAFFLFNRSGGSKPDQATVAPQVSNELLPGGNKAVLKLADGTTILLDSAKGGLLSKQGAANVVKLEDGQLAYNTSGGNDQKPLYNTIETPNGGQYAVVLSDGTKVWLNATSTLRFPATFTEGERRVTLTGEAYFEVVHNSDYPFIVAAGNAEIKDIGTAFNINSYPDEPAMQVTLTEGLASVSAGGKEVQLKPGKVAALTGQDIRLADADVQSAVAWKNGLFQFKNASIESIMRQVARWYDVEVAYDGTITQLFSGAIYRNSKASEVFKILEKGGNVQFVITGKKIVVKPL